MSNSVKTTLTHHVWFSIHTWSWSSDFPLIFSNLNLKKRMHWKHPLSPTTSSLGENHTGQCRVMLPWLHPKDESLQGPSSPRKNQTYEPFLDSHFPTRRWLAATSPSIRMSPSPQIFIISPAAVWWYWICFFQLFSNQRRDVADTHTHWLMTDSRQMWLKFIDVTFSL